jgi:hypothetical protein
MRGQTLSNSFKVVGIVPLVDFKFQKMVTVVGEGAVGRLAVG